MSLHQQTEHRSENTTKCTTAARTLSSFTYSSAACRLDTNKLPPAPKCTPIVVPATSTSIFNYSQKNARDIVPHEARSFPPHATKLMTNGVIMSLRMRCTAGHWLHSPPPHSTTHASGCALKALIAGDELLGRLEQLAQIAWPRSGRTRCTSQHEL